jgi:hypothetical protein
MTVHVEIVPSVVDRIKQTMVGLKMPRAIEILDATMRRLERGEVSPLEAIDALLAEEFTLRENRRVKTALGLTRRAHHAIAEALHIELAHVAFSVCGFGLFLADQLTTHLLQWPPLRGKRRGCQRDERKRHHNRPHVTLHVAALAGARRGAFIIPATAGRM